MLNNRKSWANASVSLGALLVGVSLFSVTASAQSRRNGKLLHRHLRRVPQRDSLRIFRIVAISRESI